MIKKIIVFVVSIICSANLFAQTSARPMDVLTPPPQLVVGIVIDQMQYDYIYRFWAKYRDDGFKRLVNEGFSCKNTHHNYVPTYTAPGHASIYTGTTPSVHGIIANEWYDHLSGRYI